MFASGKERSQPGLLSINGYVHVQWMYDFDRYAVPKHGFDLRRGRIEFRYDIADKVGAEIEIGCDKLALTAKDAYLEYRISPALGFTAGLRKMPFSREELTPASKLFMIERSETNDMFGDQGYLGRDIGVTLQGESLPFPLPVGYSLGVYNGNGDRVFEDHNDAKQFCERLTVQPLGAITVGLNGSQRNDSLTGNVLTAWGADIAWQTGRVSADAEVLYGNRGTDRRMFGAYLVGAYRLAAFEPGLRLETVSDNLADSRDRTTAVTAACNLYLYRKVQLKTNLVVRFPDWQPKFVAQAQVGF
ncbi:MAG: porin [candidate division WOR-3 bacterium]